MIIFRGQQKHRYATAYHNLENKIPLTKRCTSSLFERYATAISGRDCHLGSTRDNRLNTDTYTHSFFYLVRNVSIAYMCNPLKFSGYDKYQNV
jgi:hypothetical protein